MSGNEECLQIVTMAIDSDYSLKNLIFSRAIPCLKIPFSTKGHRVYDCSDCGDQFVFQSTYKQHIDRVTVLIKYGCKECNTKYVFYNRCKLLEHIRSHVIHKKTTINLTDLSLDILPFTEYASVPTPVRPTADRIKPSVSCFECKRIIIIFASGRNLNQSRAHHYMQTTDESFMCLICPFIAPSECALMAHTRFHLKQNPFICPECGMYETQHILETKNHLCKGFNMIQDTTRVQCIIEGCTEISHPELIIDHIQKDHLRPIFNCPLCFTAFGKSSLLDMHLKNEHNELNKKVSAIYMCELCNNRGLQEIDLKGHYKCHSFKEMYQCWVCNEIFNDIFALYQHCIALCSKDRNIHNNNMLSLMNKCRQCNRTFIKKKSCPFKCSESKFLKNLPQLKNVRVPRLKCPVCKRRVKKNWLDLKKHFKSFHKGHKCVDLSVKLKRMNIDKYTNKINVLTENKEKETELYVTHTSDTIDFACLHCNKKYISKESLEKHLVLHKDPLSDYQCLDCGICFSEKPLFMNHLIKEHNINDVDVYINIKKVVNKNIENNIVTVDNH